MHSGKSARPYEKLDGERLEYLTGSPESAHPAFAYCAHLHGGAVAHMKTIAVAINKGGAGKTTLARSLGTAAAASGLNVLLLDMDVQQSATQWGRRRNEGLPLVRFTTENDLPAELDRAEAAQCDLVIIDTPPGRGSEAPAAVEAADFVLIPFTADIEAFEQLPRTARLARTTGKTAIGILNQATPNSRSEEEAARGVLETLGMLMAPTVLHRFKAHRDASRGGLTAQELEPDSKPAAEINALWEWLSAELQIGTRATVHIRRASA
jgi:chromosome partitioning protein